MGPKAPEPSKKIIFITGGARSGKSIFAEELAGLYPGPRAYLATAQALDEEMAERIRRHRARRPADWQSIEEPIHLPETLADCGGRFGLILLDCLTLWISNLLVFRGEEEILQESARLLKVGREISSSLILIGNEVGQGIVPANPAARAFRDLNGLVQQRVARAADEVYLMACGIPQKLKGN